MAAANCVARRLARHHDGGQAQFIEAPEPAAREGGRFGQVLDRLRSEPARNTGIAGLARDAGMSRRTFLRRFKAGTGATPGAWLARARQLLETTQLGLDDVAAGAGFGTPICAITSARS